MAAEHWIKAVTPPDDHKIMLIASLTGMHHDSAYVSAYRWFWHVDRYLSGADSGLNIAQFNTITGYKLGEPLLYMGSGTMTLAEAMADRRINWLAADSNGRPLVPLVVVEFERYFGQCSKLRARRAKASREHRSKRLLARLPSTLICINSPEGGAGGNTPPAPADPPDALLLALSRVFGVATDLTLDEHLRCATALAQLKATPADLVERAARYKAHRTYGRCAFTPKAVIGHWNELVEVAPVAATRGGPDAPAWMALGFPSDAAYRAHLVERTRQHNAAKARAEGRGVGTSPPTGKDQAC
jgi:hypothetical protein